MIKKNKDFISPILSPPILPQEKNGVIDSSKLGNDLVIKVRVYNYPHINDRVVVYLNEFISTSLVITRDIINDMKSKGFLTFTIPFFTIPYGKYNIYYTITNWAKNKSKSKITPAEIINSDLPVPPVVRAAYLKTEVLANGTPANGYTPNSVLITAFDEKNRALPGVKININSNDKICVKPSFVITDKNGQAVFSATSDIGGISSVKVSSADIKHNVELYFSLVNEAILKVTGNAKYIEEDEVVTIRISDAELCNPIKNSIVYYKIEQEKNVTNVLEFDSSYDTLNLMTTDDFGYFKINLKSKLGGSCLIRATANNFSGSVLYIRCEENGDVNDGNTKRSN